MGQNIMFTTTAVQIKAPERDTVEWDNLEDRGNHTYIYPQFRSVTPWNYPDVDEKLFNSAGIGVFTADLVDLPFIGTSYGAWEDFRAQMAQFFANSTVPDLMASPEQFKGRVPFFNLLTHVFTEAQLTPSAVRLLASDFRTASRTNVVQGWSQEETFFATIGEFDREHFTEMYRDLRVSVLATARVGGMMIFG